MDVQGIRDAISSTYAGVDVVIGSKEAGSPEVSWGDTFFIYDPEGKLEGARQFPFATIVTKDYGEFDKASNLNREGVFRLNIGVSKQTFQKLFGGRREHDFTAMDTLMPHPVYAEHHWVCVLNPSDETYATLTPLLDEAYEVAVRRYRR